MRIYGYYYWLFMVIGGIIMTIISFFHAETLFNVFFNICLGLFIGGILMSVMSVVLAEMSTHDQDTDHFDHVDHVDHFDHVDHVDHFDHVDHADHFDDTGDSIDLSDPTPAPFMLLFSTHLLVFGISGIIFYFVITDILKFMIFFLTPVVAYIITHYISVGWKKIAKSRYYVISSTINLIGKKGEVILYVDERGGVIKIPSQTPMKFEKIHVKPLNSDSRFERGEKVYILSLIHI